MATVYHTPFPQELADMQARIEVYAREAGLDFFPTIFEVVDFDQINEIAACGGFPSRYPHWRFGMEYEQLSKGYAYGLQKIYEMVINNDPCYAYLLKSNAMTDHKMVMAHVYGHCDFFKNNEWFRHTNRKMMDETANHAARIRGYMDRFGTAQVEEFIDVCLSVDDLIDIHLPFMPKQASRKTGEKPFGHESSTLESEETSFSAGRFRAKNYLDPYVNPPRVLEAEREKQREKENEPLRFPAEPERDVMLFLLEHAPLKPWQADVLSILREEAYYFAPQGQTKIMNEGWASYWHSNIMTRQGLEPGEVIQYCDHHSGTMATSPGRLNPYKLGIELFRDIEERWNKGRFGKEYDECDDWSHKKRWDTRLMKGREKIFEVRKIHNDLTFIDTFLTLDFCREYKLFSFGYNSADDAYEIESREFPKIKERLLAGLTNMGRPIIAVRDGNYKNRGELFLEHRYEGVELQSTYAQDTLANLHRLWQRPVHIETILEGKITTLSYDGAEMSEEKVESSK